MTDTDMMFDVSVIIPVFNTEQYVADTLLSLERQTIGFDRIQVLIIDDGSTDSSLEICRQFADTHPDNVTLISKENSGVADSRNVGLSLSKGRLVTFLDSDDQWSDNAFETAVDFFDHNDSSLEVLVADMNLIGKEGGKHTLSYRFKGEDHTIDVQVEPCSIQSTINCFIKREAVAGISFDTDISISEDTLFFTKVISRQQKYGCTSRCCYYYQKREDGSSASQRRTIGRHLENLEVCRRLLSFENGRDPSPFAQAVALYILCWQVFDSLDDAPTDGQKDDWTHRFTSTLKQIDDSIICNAPWLSQKKRLYFLQLKHGADVVERFDWEDSARAYLHDSKVFTLNSSGPCNIYQLDRRGDILHIEGTTNLSCFMKPFSIQVSSDDGTVYPAKLAAFPREDTTSLVGTKLYAGYRFIVDLPARPGMNYSFSCTIDGVASNPLRLFPRFYTFAKLDEKYRHSYCVMNDLIIKYRGKRLWTFSYRKRTHIASELRHLREIISDRKFSRKARASFTLLRILYHVANSVKKKPVWLFYDKEWKAGDNGENVYRRAMQRLDLADIDRLFVLSESSPDAKKVSEYGTVLDPDTRKFKLKFLLADKVFSSRCEFSVLYPFAKRTRLVRDLLSFDFIYLTHGTLFGDLSSMLNKVNKMITLFSVSTEMERQALLRPEYGYADSEVKLLGMARYDAYKHAHADKTIAFLPTWRSHIAGKIIPGTTEREYSPTFKDTEYCKQYNSLINDPRLIASMKRNGYRGEFYVHPSHDKQAGDFKGNEVITVGEHSADYEKVLSTSSLLITDYSGVGFDFGYQRKPIVYTQFDSIFEGGHTYGQETYFDYQRDGFGPVAQSIDAAVDKIIGYIESGCVMEATYRQRADRLFGYSDYNACDRILDAALQLDSSRC